MLTTAGAAAQRGLMSGQAIVAVSQPLYRDRDLLGFVALSLSQDLLRSTHSSVYWAEGARIVTFNRDGQALSGAMGDEEDPTPILPQGQSLASLVATPTTAKGQRSRSQMAWKRSKSAASTDST